VVKIYHCTNSIEKEKIQGKKIPTPVALFGQKSTFTLSFSLPMTKNLYSKSLVYYSKSLIIV